MLTAETRAQAPPSGGAAPAPAYRVLRTVSGSQGEVRDAQYVVLDPRVEFQVPADTQVIVYFEWLGTPGPHKLSGTWRGPSDTSTTTAFDYTARDREFGAYWVLTLPPTIPQGDWRLDASIDGRPAGTHAFRIVPGPTSGPATAARRLPLTRQELYERGLAALVSVDALDATGARLQSGLGVLTAGGRVLTSFSAVNMATRLRVRTRAGDAVDVDSLVALSYRGGWAIVPATSLPPGATPLPTASAPLAVGAPCFSFDSPGGGTYVITTGEVSGMTERPGADARVSLSLSGLAAPGAPLLNEFGELAGVIPSNVDGRDTLRTAFTVGAQTDRSTAVPIGALPAAPEPAVPLSKLAATGAFVPLVTASRHVLNGGFATAIQGRGPSATPVDQRNEFTTKDRRVLAFVTWMPKERIKGLATARIYDMANRLLGESKPFKANINMNALALSSWDFPVPPVGTYRVDVLHRSLVAWRGHFVVTE